MRFRLTENQRTLRNEVRSFEQEEILPRSIELDQSESYPSDILASLRDQELTGLTIPEEYGGRGDGLVELALVSEELSAALMSVASTLALHLGVATVVERFGTDAQREQYLPKMTVFDTVGALGLSEENAGSDKLQMETTAERDGNKWVLDGHKRWVTNYLHADVVLTYVKTGSDERAPHNISAFLVPTEEFEVKQVWDTLGARSAKAVEVTLSGVQVSADRMVGEEGEAYVERRTINDGINVPARGVGIARAALKDTIEYTSQREQHGQTISDFQGVRWTVAKMAERVDTAHLLTLRAADRASRGEDVSREFSAAKIHATQAAVDNANDAI